MARFVVGSQGRAVSPMVVSVHNKPLVGERIGNVIVSADVLTHAMYQHDDARARLVILRGPAIPDELRVVGGTAGERAGSDHLVSLRSDHTNIKMVRPKQSSVALSCWSRQQPWLHICLDTRPDICVSFSAMKLELVGSTGEPGTKR